MSSLIELTRKIGLKKAVVLAAAAAAAVCLVLYPMNAPAEPHAPIPDKVAACAGCHPEATQSWANSLHRRTVGAPQIPEAKQACDACHYGTQEHMADVTDVSKRPSLKNLTSNQVSAICQNCHRGGQQALWDLSAHSRTKDGCLTCHDPHRGVGDHMLKAEEPDLCQTCHPGPVAEGNLPFHHPIKEGKMVCTDCHNVHGEQRGTLPEASNGEMCFKCHPDKAGPFVAEHPPVTEDCTICHRPHGSPVRKMLVEDMPMLCLQCHPGHSDASRSPLVATSPNNPNALTAIGAFYSRCTSCHTRIHGSDLLAQTGDPVFMPGSPLVPLGDHVTSVSSTGYTTAAEDINLWGFADIDAASLSEKGNQTYVRQYDGRDYKVPDADLSITKYGKSDDFRFETTDLSRGNQEIRLRMGNPLYDLQIHESGLTHRLGRFDENANVNIPGSNGTLKLVNDTDLTNGKTDFQIDRTLVDVRFAARCPKVPNAKWLLNYWQDSKTGNQQFLFLDRCTSCHKMQADEPIDQINTITEEGVQVDFPKASLRYLRGQQEFSNRASDEEYQFNGQHGIYNGLAPLFGVANTQTDTNDLRVNGALSQRASAALLWSTKDRNDLLGGGQISIRSLGGGINYLVSPALRLQASHYQRDLDVNNDTEEGISRNRDTTRLDLTYSGLPHTLWSAGYQKETVGRQSQREVAPESDSDIWSSSLRFQPISRLNLLLRYQTTKTDDEDILGLDTLSTSSRLVGLPNDGKQLSAVLGYTLAPDTVLTGMYTDLRNLFDVVAPGVNRQDEIKTRTDGVQITHSRKRGQISVGYYRQTGDNGGDVTYGSGTFTLAPPLIATSTDFPPIDSTAAFHYQATILTADSSWWLTNRVRLFGRCDRTRTNGQQNLFDLGDYIDDNPDLNGVAVVLNPFNTTVSNWWLGVGYVLDKDTEVTLSRQRADWTDTSDPTQDGNYGIWRVGVRKKF